MTAFRIALQAFAAAGADPQSVIRTRMSLVDPDHLVEVETEAWVGPWPTVPSR